jgi:phospholipid/cholesterol/gamma-HCH transport system substrate-binding protein
METKSQNVLVGAFVLAGILGFITIAVWLSGTRTDVALYQSNFAGPVVGLASGTPVRYNGIDIGRVSKVDLDPDDPKRVVALLEVRPDLPIRQDSIASVESEGLTGGSYVEIEGGNRDAPLLEQRSGPPYPAIASRNSAFQQFKQDAPRLLSALNKTAERASDLLNDENREAVARTLASLTAASDRLSQVLLSADKAVRSIDDAVGKIGMLSEDVSSALSDSKAEIKTSAAQVNQAFVSIDIAAKRVDRLGTNLDNAVTSLKTDVKDGIGQLNQFLGEGRSMVESVTQLSEDLRRQPTQLLFGDQRQGYKPK